MIYTYVIVDDEALIRRGTIKKLEALGDCIKCIGEAENGAKALEIIAVLNPDLVITDMNMPVFDGSQFLPIFTERYPEKRIIVISGYKDFVYMKQAITAKAVDYILKPFSKEDIQNAVLTAIAQLESKQELESQLISSKEKQEIARYEYDMQMLKNLILGYNTTNMEITSSKLNFINSTHDLILMTLHSNHSLNESIMQQYMTENGFGDLALFLQHNHHQNLGFFILFIPAQAALSPTELCWQIIRSLSRIFQELGQNVSYGISQPHHSLLELHDAFIETVNALNSKIPGDMNGSYFYESQSMESKQLVWDKTEEFLFQVEAGEKERTGELLNQLFHMLSSLEDYTLYDIKVFCFWLSDQVRHMMTEYFEQINPNTASSSMQNILDSMFSISELREHYLQYYLNIADVLKENSVYSTDDVIEKMKIYMERHYQNNITIEFLSSLFYMNRSYCSHLFKERTGDNFVNYLNHIRLEKAKYLLLHTDKKMYQIAKSVGYDNVKYFFRIFKKKEHVTPEQYRKSIT